MLASSTRGRRERSGRGPYATRTTKKAVGRRPDTSGNWAARHLHCGGARRSINERAVHWCYRATLSGLVGKPGRSRHPVKVKHAGSNPVETASPAGATRRGQARVG